MYSVFNNGIEIFQGNLNDCYDVINGLVDNCVIIAN